jgi:hypothetical protein
MFLLGVAISRQYRNRTFCHTEGNGETKTTLDLDLNAALNDEDKYCGVSINHVS